MTTPTQQQFRDHINRHYPDRPQRLPQLTTDELVCSFLALHDVAIKPVGADIRMSRSEAALTGAAYGLINPVAWDTMATGSQMRQDARIAAKQEWTSWKQWTLSHADWADFKQNAVERYNAAAIAAEAWESDPSNQDAFQRLLEEAEAATWQHAERGAALRQLLLVAGLVLSVVYGAVVYAVVFRGSNNSAPAAIEQPLQR
jgi:hypothetical protein